MNQLVNQLKGFIHLVSESLMLLTFKEKRKFFLVVGVQIVVSMTDLIAVTLIGVLGALAVRGVQSEPPGIKVVAILNFLKISHLTLQTQILFIGVSSCFLLILRTITSIYFTKKTLYFLSRRSASIAERLVDNLLNQSLVEINEKTIQENTQILTTGVSTILLGILGTLSTMASDFAILLVMASTLFIVSPITAIATILLFGFTGVRLFSSMSKRSSRIGKDLYDLTLESNEKLFEALGSFREIFVHNRQGFYSRRVGEVRQKLSETLAEQSFLPNVSKYFFESLVVIGALIVSAIQFAVSDAVHAVATLSIFMVAGSRIAPAILRLQQGAIQVRISVASSPRTFDVFRKLSTGKNSEEGMTLLGKDIDTNYPFLEARKVSFKYTSSEDYVIDDVSLVIERGKIYGIVGESGAGKSTLVDLLLGTLMPEKGTILLNGLSIRDAIKTWPNTVSYVPQDTSIINGTIRQNVSMGFEEANFSDDEIWEALESAKLAEHVRGLPEKLDSPVGGRGVKISGGQRQRLGIARALVTRPQLLVMDEATSSLDGSTEQAITETLANLKGQLSIILIAHRLSTVVRADKLFYLENGTILASGSFEEIKRSVPDFEKQAKLMGL
jgi:ATP-binding cassette subfamily C protein